MGDRVMRLLKDLESARHKLQGLFDRKRTVLSRGTAAEIAGLADEESKAVAELRELLTVRQQILGEAKRSGIATGSLRELVPYLGMRGEADALERMNRLGSELVRMRREGWGHWIVANRNYNHHTFMLELIAHHGQASPTYSRHPQGASNSGGAILDTSI